MSDFTASLPGSTPALLDTSRVSANLDQIHAVENGWSLPKIPDLVKLDLAQFGGDKTNLNSFLYGLEKDLKGNEGDEATGFSPIPVNNGRSVTQELANEWGGWSGLKPPQTVDTDAVQIFKADAVAKGYLPENTTIDSRWDPAYSSVQHQMFQDQYDARMGGQRPGAASWQTVAKLFNDWGSPSGLLRAAVQLDFLPDPKAIGSEFSHWGEKWAKLGKSKNPFDFGKNLVDALTGPIDDIVVPVLNDILLFTGVGEATAFGRLAFAVEKGVDIGETASHLYQGAKAVKLGTELETFQKAGWLAKRAPGAIGDAMEGWRRLPAVASAKKLTQTAMKLGVVSRLEDHLPGYQGGIDAAHIPGVRQAVDDFTANPLVWGVGEALFTPTTIFGHGAVSRLGHAAGGKLITVTEHTLSPVIGAVGGALDRDSALLRKFHIQQLGRRMSNLSFKRVTEQQELMAAIHGSLVDHLTDSAPDLLNAYQETVRKKGVTAAIAELHGMDSHPDAVANVGAALAYGTTMAGIDATVTGVLEGSKIARGSMKYRASYHLYRNRIIAQVRQFDETDKEGVLSALATIGGGSKKQIGHRFRVMMDDATITDDKVASWARSHNVAAQQHLKDMLAHATPDVVRKYMPKVWDTFGNWPVFSEVQQGLHEARLNGLFDDVQYLNPKSPAGMDISAAPEFSGITGRENMMVPPTVQINPHVHGETKGAWRPLARRIDPGLGRLTWMRKGTLAKHQVLEKAFEVRQAIAADTAFKRLTATSEKTALLSGVDRKLAETGLHLGSASPETVANLIREASEGKQVVSGKSLETIRSYMRQNDVTFDQVGEHLGTKLQQLEFSPDWGPMFGFESIVRDAKGTTLNGPAALAVRQKQLYNKSYFTAAEIDMEHLLANATEKYGADSEQVAHLTGLRAQAEAGDYKLVHGVEFAAPVDLMDRGMPFSARGGDQFPDITQRHINAVRLGMFAQAHEHNPMYVALNARARRTKIAEALDRAHAEGRWDKGQLQWHNERGIINPEAPDIRRIDDELWNNIIRPIEDTNADAQAQLAQAGVVSRFGHRVSTSLLPRSSADLGLNRGKAYIMKHFAPEFGDAGADAIWKGLKQSRVKRFEDVGVAQWEQKLRSKPIVTDALKTLSGTGLHQGWTRVGGTIVGGAVGASLAGDQNPLQQLGAGVVGAVAGGAVGPTAARFATKVTGVQKFTNALENSAKWNRYTYLADEVMQWRDVARFSLSPMFDTYRYAHGAFFGVAEDVGLKVNQSPSALRRAFAKEFQTAGHDAGTARRLAADKWQRSFAEFKAAAKGDHNFEDIDSAQRWFSQVGILGYDPTAYMASTFHQLHTAGWDAKAAYEKTRDIYHYGMHGRSALNQSINTVFFPFSFQAKQMKALASFVGKDWGRAVVMHDAYKTYEVLNQHYDLNKFWRNHMPAFAELERLNMFAHGVSPGILGGMNRPFIDMALGAPDVIKNFFSPQAVAFGTQTSWEKMQKTMKRLLPAYNDVNLMVDGLKQQGHVVFSKSHQIASEEASSGFQAWRDYKQSVNDALSAKGYKWADLYNNDSLAGLQDAVTKKKLQLEGQYPGWKDAKTRAVTNIEAINAEIKEREANYRQGTPMDPAADGQFMQFKVTVDKLDDFMRQHHLSTSDDMDKLPLEMINGFRNAASSFAAQPGEAGSGFLQMYKKYWLRRFGPITRDV